MSSVVLKDKRKLHLKDVGDSMLCERRWEGELSVKLTIGAVEDHTIVPDFEYLDIDFDRYVRLANTTFEDHAIVPVRCSAFVVTMVMNKILNIFCHIFIGIKVFTRVFRFDRYVRFANTGRTEYFAL